MSWLELHNGVVYELKWIELDGITHSRFVGERLTNCATDVPLFELQKADAKPGARLCEACERTLALVKSVRTIE